MDPTNLNGTAKAVIVVSILVFCYGMVTWIVINGLDNVTAHDTIWWCFATPLMLMAGIGFPGVIDLIRAKLPIATQDKP